MFSKFRRYNSDAFIREVMNDIQAASQVKTEDEMLDEKKSAVELSKGRMDRKGLNKKIKNRLKKAKKLDWYTNSQSKKVAIKDGEIQNPHIVKAIGPEKAAKVAKGVTKTRKAERKTEKKKKKDRKGKRDVIDVSVKAPKPKARKVKARLIKTKAKRALDKAAKDPSPENIKSVKDAARDLGKSLKHSFKQQVAKTKAALTKEYKPFDKAAAKLGGKVKGAVKGFFSKLFGGSKAKCEAHEVDALFEAFYQGFMEGVEDRLESFYDACDGLQALSESNPRSREQYQQDRSNHVTHMQKPNYCDCCGAEGEMTFQDRQGRDRWYKCEVCESGYHWNGRKGRWDCK